LRRYFETGDRSKLSVQNLRRLDRILERLDTAVVAEDMNIPGWRFHALKGKLAGRMRSMRAAIGASPSAGGRGRRGYRPGGLSLMADSLLRGIRPVHPAEILREDVIPALGRPKAQIARLMGISRQTLYDLLNERQPATAGMALRIGKLTGTTAESWLRMQGRYDMKIAEREMADEIAKIPTLREAA
jgi:addiction module HigA family antidote